MNYWEVVKEEAISLGVLWKAKVLPTERLCSGKNGSHCGFQLIQKKRTGHCKKQKGRKKLSVAHDNAFLFRKRLFLSQILEIIWLLLHSNETILQIQDGTGYHKDAVVSWWCKCSLVCTFTLDKQPKLVGKERRPIEVDEQYFSGRRKYNRRWLLNGDKPTNDDDGDEMCELEEWDNAAKPGMYYQDGAVFNKDVKDWLWVVGIYKSYENVRSLHVKDRTERTLECVLDKYIAPSSVVWKDEFKGYSSYAMSNFIHETVDHKEKYVD